jgi:hypothetical protein
MDNVSESPARRRGRPPKPAIPKAEIAGNFAPMEAREAPHVDRPVMRPSLREEDPRAAAARRAAEIRGHLGNMDEGTDEFRAPPPPDGWEYEWKRKTILGQEDPAYQVHLARMGWEAVPTTSHPEMMPGMGNYPTIERKGQVLMMRPAVISAESRSIELKKARNQVKHKEAQLNATPEGTLSRDDPRVRPVISKGYEPISVPQE